MFAEKKSEGIGNSCVLVCVLKLEACSLSDDTDF
jgi:hypothetical protein